MFCPYLTVGVDSALKLIIYLSTYLSPVFLLVRWRLLTQDKHSSCFVRRRQLKTNFITQDKPVRYRQLKTNFITQDKFVRCRQLKTNFIAVLFAVVDTY